MHAGDKNETFSGRVERVVHVATVNDVNLMLYEVMLAGEPEWLRICTTRVEHEEKIAFLNPGALVEIRVGKDINIQGRRTGNFTP